jgi:hypothetical protein
MVDLFVNLLEDVEQELGMAETHNLRKLADQLQKRLHKIADALDKLESKGWTWTTGPHDVYLHKSGATDKDAEKDLREAGMPDGLSHIVH